MGGQVWKCDLSAPATLASGLVDNWLGKRFFAAPLTGTNPTNPPSEGEYYPAQAIYGSIIPAYDDQNNLWLYFGTGDRNHPNNTTAPNRIYGITDTPSMTNGTALTESNLVDVTSANNTAPQGWYIRLGTNEKILASADVFNKVVFFSSFTPVSTTICGSTGDAKLYAVQMSTGYAALDWANGGALLTTSSATDVRAKTIGTGIPTKPIVIVTDSQSIVTANLLVCTTSEQCPINPAPPPTAMRRILYWRELVRR